MIAIRLVFGDRGERIAARATKSMHGHLLGEARAIPCVLSLLAMQHANALSTMHPRLADPACDPDDAPTTAHEGVAARVMLSNPFAFDVSNAILVLRRRKPCSVIGSLRSGASAGHTSALGTAQQLRARLPARTAPARG